MQEFDILAEIIEELAGIQKEILVSKIRKRQIVELRMICSNIIAGGDNLYSLAEIGSTMNIDHSTVCYHMRVHGTLMIQRSGTYKSNYNIILKEYNCKVVFLGENVRARLVKKKRRLEEELQEINIAIEKWDASENLVLT